MNTFYKKLIAEFAKADNKEKFTSKDIASVSYIDLYAGQEQFEENFELFAQPALLVDWDIDYSGDIPMATVTLYCCFEQLRDTSNISANTDLGLKFLEYVACINDIAITIESETTGKLEIVSEGFHKMDSIVDIYLLTYECSFKGRKKPLDKYKAGDYDKLNLDGNLKHEFD